MGSPKSDTKRTVSCDFCSDQVAVLYCRADSAKLCLFCDQHVHSANLLSRKHLRSQICDNCSSEPVSVRCETDNLVLCRECDWDAHGSCSVSASHDRTPIEGFSGCPSALELASIWGFDLQEKKLDKESSVPLIQSWSGCGVQDMLMQIEPWVCRSSGGVSYMDSMVPNDKAMVYGNGSNVEMVTVSKRKQIPSCGKYKQVIFKQLMGLLKRNMITGDGGGGENLMPETPSRNGWHGNVEAPDFVNGNDGVTGANGASSTVPQQPLQEQAPFTSFIMLPSPMDLKPSGRVVGDNIMWGGNASAQGTQVTLGHHNCPNFLKPALHRRCISISLPVGALPGKRVFFFFHGTSLSCSFLCVVAFAFVKLRVQPLAKKSNVVIFEECCTFSM
ncbi:hypothetical protein P3X46_005658 [Hevea brasiliensis]|uniref:B box-type domain-containing protein n=1 Tax=Hevea brasiliensis TaxID=3981 RepID=A0ABQ9N0P2_HEVBR|nr:hypothetical protein P3X46_005658 [Hevea brasiliensis]